MAKINTKLIKYATQARFDIDIAKVPAVVDPKSIIFIEDTGRIYAHGKYFGGAWEDITDKPTTFAPSAHTHSNFTRTAAGFTPAPTTNTTTRYLREDGTWVVPPNTGDTHWTTGIRAGASGTNANSVATDPFIKVLDNTTYRSQIQILGGTNITANSDATGKITIDGAHNHTLKLIAGASTATTNSTADVANPYVRLFSDNAHQGNIQIVGGTNVGAVSKNGVITLTATDTTYSAGNYMTMADGNKITGNYGLLTKALLDGGTNTTYRVTTAAQMHAWLEGKNFSTESFVNNAINNLEIGGRNLINPSEYVATSGWEEYFNVDGYNIKMLKESASNFLFLYLFPVQPNQEYTLSFEDDGNFEGSRIYEYSDKPTSLHNNRINYYLDKPSGFTFKTMNTVKYLGVGLIVRGDEFPRDFNNWQLEKGNKSTDWSPAPEDQISDWNETSVNSFSFIKNKPTKLSEFSNDLGNYGSWITKAQGDSYYAPKSHTHSYLPLSGGTIDGDLYIGKSNGARWLTLPGAAPSDQRTGISIGESGKWGSAALHIYYTGDGVGHIGMGTMSGSTDAANEAIRLSYTSRDVTFLGNINATGKTITATTFSGNATTATTASKLTINSSASASWFNILWNSDTTVYGSANNKLRVQPSTGSITSGGTITGSDGIFNGALKSTGSFIFETTLSSNYKEGVRFNRSSGGWGAAVFGGVRGSVDGISEAWWLARNPDKNFVITYGTSTGSGGLELPSSGNNIKWRNQLIYHAGNIPTWNQSTTGNAATASAVSTSAENSNATSRYILFANSASGNQALKTDSGLKYVPSTNTITATLAGNASSATTASSATYASAVTLTADNTTNATRYPLFASAATGNLSPRTDTGFTYNPSTGALTSTSFVGNLTGNASSATIADTIQGKTTTITITGDANTYYPVVITGTARKTLPTRVSVWKNLGSATNSSYSGNHSTGGTSSLWLLYETRRTVWDGNGGYHTTLYKSQPYATLVSNTIALPSSSGDLTVWLRGGGTLYNISSDNSSVSATVYYGETVIGSNATVAPRTDIGNGGIYNSGYTLYAPTTGNAATATALTTSAGSATQPVYFSGGKPVAATAYANASVSYATSAGTATSAGSATNATNTTNINTLADNSSNADRFILFSDAATGNQRAKTDSGLKYNPSSNTITATLAGNATTATTATYLTRAGASITTAPSTYGLRFDSAVGSATAGIFPTSNNSNAIITLNRHSGAYDSQLGFSSDRNIYYRAFNGAALNTTQAWNKLWHSGNFANGATNQYIRGDGSLATYSDTKYSAGTKELILLGTNTTNRVWSSRTLKDWYLEEINILLDSDRLTGSTFPSNVIDLTNVNGAFNVDSVNNYTTYTLSNRKVRGAWAKVLVNSSIPITVTGVKLINLGSSFEVNTNMYLNVMYDGINTLGYYTKVTGTTDISYYISTSSAVVIFTNTNTPIDKFSNSGTTISIAGVNVSKNIIKDIRFSDEYSNTTSINNYFLQNCTSLTSVNLSPMTNVTSIGHSFLNGCTSLTSVDLSSMTNVTSISSYFLQNCTSLTSVNLSPMTNVTSIGHSFLNRCSSLTSVNLSSMTNVTSISSSFLQRCNKLTSVDLSSMTNVTTIGDYSLNGCSSLTSLDLSSMTNLTSIGDWVLQGSGLKTLKMGALVPPSLATSPLPNTLTSILVPSAAVNAYKSAGNWSQYASIISGY